MLAKGDTFVFMIKRLLEQEIKDNILTADKVIIVYGPRQVGKTTIIDHIIQTINIPFIKVNADDLIYADVFESRNYKTMMDFIGSHQLLFIDEAQNVKEIGSSIKILHDRNKALKIILSGSSSFDLANKTQEPLTGRTKTFNLFPLSIKELSLAASPFEINQNIDQILTYGLYPEVYSYQNIDDKRNHLLELTEAYLYKDILNLSGIKNNKALKNLLQLLALQVGKTVSINKLSNALNISSETVNNYIDILEKAFIIYRVQGYSKNLAKEISKMDKIYFYDLGVRNAVLGNFSSIRLRADMGGIWENFLITERKKNLSYKRDHTTTYFWRTYTGAEIDYIEEKDGLLHGFEIKMGTRRATVPKSWQENYPNSTFNTINESLYLDWLLN
ncbi:MAG TPA: ATP-binding protein [Saprospiraceae bacterium]|nr:ATP-binding protein [Saprospiraceae bacterium]